MRSRYFGICSFLALSSTAVHADGAYIGSANQHLPATQIWQGAYLGAFAGYQHGTDKLSSDELEYFRDEPFSPYGFDIEGFTGGAFVGANVQDGNLVLGIEGEIGSGNSERQDFRAIDDSDDVNSVEIDINSTARVRARAGYSFGSVLPFVAAGVSLADTTVTIEERLRDPLAQGQFLTDELYRVGFNAGGGVDVHFGHNIFGRVEYVYDRFGSTGYGVPKIADSAHFALDMHTVRGALAYKFGGEEREATSIKDSSACCGLARWSGAYVGAFAGYQQSSDDWRSDETDPADDAQFAPIGLDSEGFTGGGLMGVAIQRGAIVASVEGDLGSASGAVREKFADSTDIDAITSEINAIAHARARVGYSFGNILPFIAGGVSVADTTITISDASSNITSESDDVYRIGLTAGAGVDVLFGHNVFARVEYLYDRFGTSAFGSLQTENSEYFDLEVHTLRGALAYKFGGNESGEPTSIKDSSPCCAPSHWSGGYVGAFAGYQQAQDDWTSNDTDPADNVLVSPIEIRSDGFTGGGYAGASIQHGAVVLSVEGDIGSGNSNRKDLTNLGVAFRTESVESEIEWTAHARFRAGYSVGNFMPFLAAGVALAGTTVTLYDQGSNITAERDDLFRVGFTVGGGVDLLLGPNLIARVEYLYDQYGGANYGSTEHFSEFFDLTTQSVRGGLAIKFD